jgi:8-oxo-dGTP diphosphatase
VTLGEHAMRYTLCFLTREDRVLMLRRRRAPNQGLWNGVGGKIEAGETPRDRVLRSPEVVSNIHRFGPEVFGGLPPRWHRFAYRNGAIETHETMPLRAFAGLADCQ